MNGWGIFLLFFEEKCLHESQSAEVSDVSIADEIDVLNKSHRNIGSYNTK